jgi:hypothetical protein
MKHVAYAVMSYYASYRFEKVHPLQCGFFRRKVRTTRRPGLPVENPVKFHLRRAWEIATTYLGFARYCLQIERTRRRIDRETAADQHADPTITPMESPTQTPGTFAANHVGAEPQQEAAA